MTHQGDYGEERAIHLADQVVAAYNDPDPESGAIHEALLFEAFEHLSQEEWNELQRRQGIID